MTLKQSREIAFPFRIGPDGGIAYVEDPYRTAFQHLYVTILTSPGERVMLPEFGAPTRSFLFESIDDLTSTELSTLIRDAARRWEPAVVVNAIRPVQEGADEGRLTLEIEFSVPPRDDVRTTVVDVTGALAGGG